MSLFRKIYLTFSLGRTHDYDIALVKINSNSNGYVRFNDHIQPACLPERNQRFVGQHCHISGWGRTKRRRFNYSCNRISD